MNNKQIAGIANKVTWATSDKKGNFTYVNVEHSYAYAQPFIG